MAKSNSRTKTLFLCLSAFLVFLHHHQTNFVSPNIKGYNHEPEPYTVTSVVEHNVSSSLQIFLWLRHCKHRLLRHSPTSLSVDRSSHRLVLLLLSGLETNPGPRMPRFPCVVCRKACKTNQKALACDDCDAWTHKDCIGLSSASYSRLGNSD